ncbi:hypothetical protein NMY22_g7806 [Coprinellus aureogranulatus]|nr:hypothetical protein NMY22_g7806 [Coprinellus aureogranulatus]
MRRSLPPAIITIIVSHIRSLTSPNWSSLITAVLMSAASLLTRPRRPSDRARLSLLHPVATATQQPSRVRVQEAAPTSELLGSVRNACPTLPLSDATSRGSIQASSSQSSPATVPHPPPAPIPDPPLMLQLRSPWTLRKILQRTTDTEERFA